MTKADIRHAFTRGDIGLGTAFWAAGMLQAEPLGGIRELRWLVSGRAGASLLHSICAWKYVCGLCMDLLALVLTCIPDYPWNHPLKTFYTKGKSVFLRKGSVSDEAKCVAAELEPSKPPAGKES